MAVQELLTRFVVIAKRFNSVPSPWGRLPGSLPLLLALTLCAGSVGTAGASNAVVEVGAPGPWAVTGLVGRHDDSRFLEILALEGGQWQSSYMAGLVLARELPGWRRGDLAWEGEVQLFRHRGDQALWEGNVAVNLRWTRFPWDGLVDTSIGFGQGLSLASERPPIEDDTRRLLHYMHVEVEMRPPGAGQLSVVSRLHHRSGAFGTYGTEGGSNFVTLGLRYRF